MNLKVRYLFLGFILMFMGLVPVWAQVDSATIAAVERIKEIKLDVDHYLYAEVTHDDWEKAYDNAKVILKERIKQWLQEQNIDDIVTYVAKSDEKFLEIKATRGNKYRAFVYVNKDDITVFSESRQILSDTVTKEEKASVSGNNAEKALSPDKDTAKASSGKKTEKLPVVTMRVDSTQQGVMHVEVQQTPTSAVTVEVGTTPVPVTPVSTPTSTPAPKRTPLESAFLAITQKSGIQAFIEGEEKKGTIKAYGKYVDRPSSGKYYMFIYNTGADIQAHLMLTDGKIVNMATGAEDTFDNYKNCGGLWFK